MTIPFGMNLIHSPAEPDMEAATVSLYLKRNVRLVEASAFLNLTLPVVRYRVAGIHRDACGANCRSESSDRQGIAIRGGVQVHGAAAGSVPARAGRQRRNQLRAGGVGGAHPDGRGHHGRGRFGRPYRQPARDRAPADDAVACAINCKPSTATTGRFGSGRPAESRRRGPRPRRSRWERPTS